MQKVMELDFTQPPPQVNTLEEARELIAVLWSLCASLEKKCIEHEKRIQDLEEKLKNVKARLKLIITDGIFSMDGDMAKLDEIYSLSPHEVNLI